MKTNKSQLSSCQNKGITLIALIITIIILLILAGVAINMVLGQNGILNNSKEATQKYKDSQEKEELSLMLSNYYMTKAEDDNVDLEAYLNENNAILQGEQDGSYIIKYKEYEFVVKKDSLEVLDVRKKAEQQVIVKENGEEKILTVSDIAKEPQKYYGARVTNYTQGASYRIFYIDTDGKYGDGANTVYLRADYDGNRIKALGTSTAAYEYDTSKTKIRQMNPEWTNYIGDLDEANWNENAKAAAYLCDTSKWTEYYDETKANYAIGGPSIELYIDSYNKTHGADSLVYTCEPTTGCGENIGKGYFVGANQAYSNNGFYPNYGTVNANPNGIYMNSYYTWFASPAAHGDFEMKETDGYGEFLGNAYLYGEHHARPLISLKSDIVIQIEI